MRVPSAVRRLDFHRLFEFGPELSIVLSPEQNYAIVAVTEAYLRATMTNREEIVGRSRRVFRQPLRLGCIWSARQCPPFN
jgi:hypothetical protein